MNCLFIPSLLMFDASTLTSLLEILRTLVTQKGDCFFFFFFSPPFRCETTPSFQQVFLVDPIFLPGIISSDTDSKYLSGFHYPLFAIINPSKREAFPKLAMQVDMSVLVCASVCELWLSVLASLCGASEGLRGSKSLHTRRQTSTPQ